MAFASKEPRSRTTRRSMGTPGYYAVFFRDPDGIKLELLHRPIYWNWLRQH
jgi:catechol 2,3-dioxygenase-like lactoylglutathione lyase family enzyme